MVWQTFTWDRIRIGYWIWLGYPEIDVCCQALNSTLLHDIRNIKYRFSRPGLLLHLINIINVHQGKAKHSWISLFVPHGNTLNLCKIFPQKAFYMIPSYFSLLALFNPFFCDQHLVIEVFFDNIGHCSILFPSFFFFCFSRVWVCVCVSVFCWWWFCFLNPPWKQFQLIQWSHCNFCLVL